MDEAIEKYDLDTLYVLYSGGKDSGCVLHHIATNYPKLFKGAVFTNVGFGAQATRKFVLDYCHRMNYKLIMTWPKESENFYNLTIKYGFVTPRKHRAWMGALKQHTWWRLMREALHRGEKAAFISGVRKDESFVRKKIKKYTRKPINFTSEQLYIKPFLYKNGTQLWNYYNEYDVEKSPVYEWLNRSGECYCGAYLAEWELKMMQIHDPFAFATIKWLEKEIQLHGTEMAKRYCKYGGFNDTEDIESQTTFEDFSDIKIEIDEDLCGESCVVPE